MRILISAIALLATGFLGLAHAQSENLAAQVDAVAAFINAENAEQLGGPSDAESIVSGLDGQWFPLNNIVRNWGDTTGGTDEDSVARSVARHCSGEVDDSTFYETIETGFSVREILGRYDTEFVQNLSPVEGRRFSVSFEDEALIRSYGKEGASETERDEILEMAAQIKQQDIEIWRPSEDILVVQSSFGLDVTGRCPST